MFLHMKTFYVINPPTEFVDDDSTLDIVEAHESPANEATPDELHKFGVDELDSLYNHGDLPADAYHRLKRVLDALLQSAD